MKRPELLAPGGSFAAASHAFAAGADGVYLGMTEFSARKAAANFTFEQLRRIRQAAAEAGKSIYVAMNTVVTEREIDRLADSLFRLEALAVQGIIVQDLGVLSILRRYFPSVAVHASTQMAVHDEAGLRFLKDLGVRRVILPRELPLPRIRALKAAVPDMELEVFIHGALCYSFSGLCLASHALTGRSGNRGECAQVCRSLFRRDDDGGAGYSFSCRDLFLGKEILDLVQAGVDALKIEGRMKSPEYVFHTVRLYREILDRGKDLPEAEYRELARKTALTFSRSRTRGYLRSASGERLIDAADPGHRGERLGTVTEVRGTDIRVTLEGDLSLHDGLTCEPPAGHGHASSAGREHAFAGAAPPLVFSVRSIRKAGREVRFARSGETVNIRVPRVRGAAAPAAGHEVIQLSSRFLDLHAVKETSTKPYKVPIELEISIVQDGGFKIGARVVSGCPALEAEAPGESFSRPLNLQPAGASRSFAAVLERLFAQSGSSLFALARLTLANRTAMPEDGIFAPPSELKRVKTEFYSHLDQLFQTAAAARAGAVAAGGRAPGAAARAGVVAAGGRAPGAAAGGEAGSPAASQGVAEDLAPKRPSLDLKAASRRGALPGLAGPLPFASIGADGQISLSVDVEAGSGPFFIPLPPVILERELWLQALQRAASRLPRATLVIGLSNVSHLPLAVELSRLDNLWFFVDFPLYVANSHASAFCSRHVPKLVFQYSWIEGDPEDYAALGDAVGPSTALLRVDPAFKAPLFYSLGCFARHTMNGGACFDDCPKDFTVDLRQGRSLFRVVVRDCVTYLFRR